MTRRLAIPVGGLVLLLAAGCSFGNKATSAFQASGQRVQLRWSAADAMNLFGHPTEIEFFGEVLAIQEDGMLIWTDFTVTSVPEALSSPLRLITFPVLERTRIRLSIRTWRSTRAGRTLRWVDPEDREFLTEWSRYGGPVGEGVLRGLMDAYGVTEISVVAPAGSLSPGQEAPSGALDEEAFLERSRSAADRYREISVAVANGYRRLGPDFPGMGEHWVHPGRIVSRELDPDHPPVLTYTVVDGRRVLTGVAYAVPLMAGESPPHTPFGPGVWHDHSDTLDEEVLLLDSPATHGGGGKRPRLAMFHAWVWPENPAGALAQNNWALPFARLGLAVPDPVEPATARALSLVGGGRDYYRTLVLRASGAEGDDRETVRAVVAESAAQVEALVAGREALRGAECAELADIWRGMWRQLAVRLSPDSWDRLRPAATAWSEPGSPHHEPGAPPS